MKCQICGKQPAKVHYTEMKDDEVIQLRLCEQCAQEKGFTKIEAQTDFSFSGILGGMTDEAMPGEEEEDSPVGCTQCGLTYRQFKSSGRLGCGGCYQTFAIPLRPLLKRIHKSDRHIGKTVGEPKIAQSRREIRELKKSLNECIDREDFEEAATLRDRIRELGKRDES